MIRDAIDFYSEKLILVQGVGKIVPYFRESKNKTKTVDLFKNDNGKIDCVILNYDAVGPHAVSDDGYSVKRINLLVSVIKEFEDSDQYGGSTQNDFDVTIENIYDAFKEHQVGTHLGDTSYTILPIDSDIEIVGNDGITEFLGTACHVAQYEQKILTV